MILTASSSSDLPTLTPAQTELLDRKRAERNSAIDALVHQAELKGELTDRLYWAMVHDFEYAKVTTNLAQLAELGIEPHRVAGSNPEELAFAIDSIARSLSLLGIYLINTDHLTDAELHRRLFEEILVEPVRDIPPNPGVTEFIDLLGRQDDAEAAPPKVCDRDRTLPQPDRPGT
jgi:hypothetical protein